MKRRAFVIVLDACGAGELPDSADYGDAGREHARPRRRGLGRARRARDAAAGPRLGAAAGRLPARRGAGRARAAAPARPGQGHDHRPLGADGRDHAGRAAHLPGRLPRGGDRPAARRDRARRALQPALLRHRRDRRLRRAAPAHRRPDRLHVGGLGAADRRARGRGAAGRALRRLPGGARDHARRARRRARDRAPVPRLARGVRAHRGAQGLRARPAGAHLPGRAAGRRDPGPHGREDRLGVQPRRRRPRAPGRDQPGGDRGDRAR